VSKGSTTEADLIAFVFHGTPVGWSGNAEFYVALHTADPGESGSQVASEAAYTGYARQPVLRDEEGWLLAGNQASNAAAITFPECAGGSETLTHFSIGLAASGAGQIIYKGPLDASLAISSLITPRFPTGVLLVTES
jgi:hypothetical protein